MEKVWAFWAKNALVKKGRSVVLRDPEGGNKEGGKVGMPPGQHLWHQGALRGGSSAGRGGRDRKFQLAGD